MKTFIILLAVILYIKISILKADLEFVKKIESDGTKYEGTIYNNKYHGYGILNSIDGTVYKGYFVNGQFHGKGILKLQDGNIYEGEFCYGKQNGKAKLIFPDGTVLETHYVNGIELNKIISAMDNFIKETSTDDDQFIDVYIDL